MRAVSALCAIMLLSTAAQAERRVFIIAGNSDAYGVDRCLTTGAHCGKAVATAYCQARDFEQALSYRKVERADITGALPVSAESCGRNLCDALVAIECTR